MRHPVAVIAGVGLAAVFGVGPNSGYLAAPVGTAMGSIPAHPGDVLLVFATGLGAVNPPVQSGHAADPNQPSVTVATPTVLIGNVPAQLLFSGLSPQFPGVYQLNIVVPQVPTGNLIPLQIQMSGVTSPPTVNIAVTSP